MKIVIFGLSVSSAWGNGHATLWRGLIRELAANGHRVVFFERDAPYYAAHRDVTELPGGRLVLYSDWASIVEDARRELRDADAAIVTSYCPDGQAASALVLASDCPVRAFYDLDTPVTLDRLESGESVAYLPEDGLGGFDLVLSYTGGRALSELQSKLGARRVAALYGSVDPVVHRPAQARSNYSADFSYLGTYSQDRQQALRSLFLEPAERLPGTRFLIGGSQYPANFPWGGVHYVNHVPPFEHASFYCSAPLTLNVTRAPMAAFGYCPSGRLFEASSCGTAVISDWWEGLDQFFTPGQELFVCRTGDEVRETLARDESELRAVGERARQRTMDEHTAAKRAGELVNLLTAPLKTPLPDGRGSVTDCQEVRTPRSAEETACGA